MFETFSVAYKKEKLLFDFGFSLKLQIDFINIIRN